MTKNAELNAFIKSAEDLFDSKYILADVKIVALLKSIAVSDSMVAILKSCLKDFDYHSAKKKYLVESQFTGGGKGEFVPPSSSKEFIALVFSILVDIDAKNIVLGDFISKYFYAEGSCFNSYNQFKEEMLKPFCKFISVVMEGVIDGSLADPISAIEQEEKSLIEKEQCAKEELENQQNLNKKASKDSILKLKDILFNDKIKIKNSNLNEDLKEEFTLVIDMLANVISSQDKDAIVYAFTAYKFAVKSKKAFFIGRIKKVTKLLENILNGL